MKNKIYSIVLFLFAFTAVSQVITPFTIKRQMTQKGGIVYLSNVATHCAINPLTAGGTCQTGANQVAPAGNYQDNDFNAVYVDIDGDASTFMSTSDSLNLPTCSQISWVGLFWGASRTNTLTTGFQTIKLKANNGAYTNITSTSTQLNTTGFNTYHCYADITTFVTAAGIKSRFTVADILTNEIGSSNRFGSWTMVVMYKNDLLTMRQLTCFNGLANISNTSAATRTVSIPISGFQTPLSGPVTFETGVYVHDGDRGSTGDNLRFNGGSGFLNIVDAVNPIGDVMNSTVSYSGAVTPFRKPNLNNTGGLDADIYVPDNTLKNYLGNSVTSCTFQMTTGGETYLPQMISTAIDVYEPDLRASIRVTDINGGTANPGDILEYRVKGINIGSDPSVNSFITDTIERNANYIPNSIRIIHGPNLGLKTDVVGDDQAEYTAGNRLIKVRIGTGATAATGGTVINSPAGADSTIFTYSVMVTNSCTKVACDNVIDARAYILGTGAVSTNTFSNGSNPGIFDAFGCPIPGTTSTPITATACATPTAGASSPGVCAGANFTLSASSDLEVTYLWSGPNSFTSVDQNPVLGPSTSSMSGVYSVTLIAYPGCSRTATTSVNINALPTLTTSASSTLFCSGVTSTLTASGAATYTWNPGALIGASVAVTPTATTIYTVTATNASGCSNTGTINLTVNAIPTLTATTSSSAICVGGTATLTSSGANTYTWNPGASTGITVVVTPTATTVYTVTGTNASGCTNTSTINLTVNSLPNIIATASSSAICIGSSSSLTATGATSYTWNPSASTGSTVVVSPTVTNIYTVTGTNASGCINSETVSLTVNTLPTAGITNSTGTTTLNCTTTAINVIATGGTTYSWSGGLGSLATATITNPGTYTVTATGSNGCSSQSVITVSQNTTAPTVGITNSTGTTTLNCTTTSINVTATGGTSYTWSGGLGSTATATITNPGTYTVTATGANGCSSQSVITVSQNTTAPTAGITNSTGTTTLNCTTTSINVTATGGTSYTWSGGLGSLATATITNPGTYTVTATGANGCSSQSVISVSQNTTAPTAGITNSTGTTTLNCTTTSINVTATGGTSYTWSGGLGSAATATIINPGSYTVTATGSNGCSSQSVITVSQSTTAPAVGITNSTGTTTLNCTTTSINVTATGGTSYTWSGGLGSLATATITNPGTYTVTATGANGCSSQSVITVSQNTTAPTVGITNSTGTTTLNCTTTSINVTATGGTSYTWSGGLGSTATATITNPGTYTVTATGANGCSSQSVITVSQNTTAPTVGITNSTGTTTLNCATTSINVTATGGTSYTWSGGLGSTATATITNPGTYTVTATGANGCSSQSVITVSQNTTAPTAGITNSTGTTTLNCTTTSINVTATGGTSYTWSGGLGSLATATITNPGTYTVTATGANGCSSQSVITVSQNTTAPTVGINNSTGTTTLNCTTTSINVTATGGTSYTWSGGLGSTATATITNPGTYTVTATASDGCSSQSVITVSQNTTAPIVIASSSSSSICAGSSVTLTASGATSYIWNPGNFSGSTLTVSPTSTTIYTLTGLAANGCTNTTTLNLTVNSIPILTLTASSTTVCSGGTITLTASGASTYTWDPVSLTGPSITSTITSTTVYSVTGESSEGCIGSSSITVSLNNCPTAVNDATNTIENTPVTGNAAANDSETVGGTFTSGTPSAGTGTLTMDPATGQYTFTPSAGFAGVSSTSYTLCNGSPIVCSSAVITVTVFPTLLANPDAVTTTTSVSTTGTLTTNDNGVVPGVTYSVSVTQLPPSTGTITIDPATGQYTFTPNPTYTGSTTTTYTICNTSVNPIVCSSTTISILVGNVPVAVADATTTIENTPVSGDASSNDSGAIPTLNPVFTSGPLTAGTGTLTMDPATGQYTYTPATGFTGTTTATYTLCNLSSPPCSTTTIIFTVFPTLVANPDVINTTPSVTVIGTLTTNDGGVVPGGTYSVTVTQPTSTTGTITVDPATGGYTFTPNPTFTGTTTTTYTLCNTSVNPIVCSTTTITINVFPNPAPIDDSNTTIENTPVSGNAGTNDGGTTGGTFTTGQPTVGTGTITMDPATGQYTYTPATGFTGTTSATYTLCNGAPTTCSTAVITVTVFPTLVANPDVITTTPSVSTTGTLTTNDNGVMPGGTYSVSVTQLPSSTGTITIDPATGQYTFTPNPTYTGSTTTTYTICNTSVNPIVCSSTTISILVGNVPVAVADATTTIENTPVSGDASSNDSGAIPTLNPVFTCGPLTAGTGTLTMDPATGQYTYTPATGFTGTTTATYTLCNLSSPPCSTTTIIFTVFPTLLANPDVIVTTPSVSTSGTLTTNDNGVVPGATYSVSVTQLPSSTGTITIDPATGQYTFTPNPTYTGSTTTTYTICNTSVNPIVCSSTTISILVGNVPVAVADATTTIENTPVSGDASSNDSGAIPTLNPVFTCGPLTAGTGTLTMDPATGQYTYTPATGFTGTTTATYTLCNLSSPPCSTTTIIFTVFPTLLANPDVIVTTPSVSTSGTLTTNDNGVVPGATYSVSVTQLPSSTGTITIDPATGQYTFTPNPTYTGSTTTTYTICNTSVNPIVCSSTTISILVGNVPVAVADATTTIENTPVSGDASSNDSGAIPTLNPVFTCGPLTAGTGTLTMDPATGQYTYTPAPGFTGTTTATYTLCNLSSPPCSTTTIIFTVFPTLVANPDVITTTPSVTVTGTLTTNDGGVVPGGTYSVTVTQPTSTTGTITVDPATGGYTFTPNPTFTGTTTTTYTLCNTSVNPIVCSTTTITIIVGTPKIAVAKTVVSTIKTNATTYQSVFSFNLANLGNTIGTNVQLVDNLNNTFPAPITYTVVGVTANSPLTSNAAYDGNTTVAMLSGTNSLNPLQNSIVTLTVNFSPNSTTLTTLSNSGVGSTANNPDPTGTGPHTSSDTTDAGTSPDPDGDGIPNEPGENDPTTFGQQIAASKTASTLTKVNATTFQTVFTFNVANVGPVTATNVQLTDNLNNTFLAPMTYTVVGLNANTPLTANGAYDGSTNIALLSGSNSLVSGANALVTLTVNFNTNSSTANTISNIGIASTATNPDPSGFGPHVSIDTTGTGTNPDPDDDGIPNEPGENDPTTFGQQIGAAKTSSGFSKLNATTFQTVFTFNVANYGAVAATNVQLTDNLNSTFPAPMTFTVVGLNANTPLTANAGYNGSSNIAMLSGTNTLNTSQSALVTLTVNFSPNTTTLTSLSNIGVASTSNLPDPTGGGTHTSTDTTGAGTDPDPDGDGNPNEPEENNPTFFGQQVAGAKTASTLIKVNATTYQTVFTFNIANVGPVTATNVQLTDNLNNTFLAPMTYTVVGLNANSPLTTNAGYNGNTNIALLSGNNTLNASQSSIVTLTVNFSPNSSTVTLLSNIGIVSSSDAPDPTGGGTHTSTDTTGAGTNPDPDGDGNPNEPGENDPITFGQQIGVSKNALSTVKLENGDNQTTFVFTLQNLGVVSATNVQLVDNLNNTFPSPITYNVVSVTSSSGLSTNTSYDGGTDINLLTGTNTLSVGSIQTVTLVVNFNMNGSSLSSLYNYGIATSSSSNGTIISSDTTNVGNNPDTDDDGNPNEPGDNIPTEFSPVKENPDEPESFNIPQGFSPNGDGVNDVFVIRGISIFPNNKLTIINRWGNVVFEKDNYDNTWDGKSTQGIRFGGDELPDGTYFYILDLGNNEKPYKGFIYISKTIK